MKLQSRKAAETRRRNSESKKRIEEAQAEMRRIVATGKCPDCGKNLKRNMTIAGWYQCEQYGAENFRKNASLPHCGFQGFTE